MTDWTVTRGRSEAHQRLVEEAEQKMQKQRRVERRQPEQTVVDQLRAEMRDLRAEVHQLHETALEVAGEAIGEFSNKTVDHVEKMIREIQNTLLGTIERRFGELMGRIDAIAPGASARSKDFKFSNERDADPVDLPNPLRRRELN